MHYCHQTETSFAFVKCKTVCPSLSCRHAVLMNQAWLRKKQKTKNNSQLLLGTLNMDVPSRHTARGGCTLEAANPWPWFCIVKLIGACYKSWHKGMLFIWSRPFADDTDTCKQHGCMRPTYIKSRFIRRAASLDIDKNKSDKTAHVCICIRKLISTHLEFQRNQFQMSDWVALWCRLNLLFYPFFFNSWPLPRKRTFSHWSEK